MDRIITLLATVALAMFIGLGGQYVWDRHAPISIPILFWRVSLPDSLLTQRDRALDAARLAQGDQQRCDAALATQNANIDTMAKNGQRSLAEAQVALDAARATNAGLRSAAAKLQGGLPMIPGETACARWERADTDVLAALMTGVSK